MRSYRLPDSKWYEAVESLLQDEDFNANIRKILQDSKENTEQETGRALVKYVERELAWLED